jgi:hypothetical protein
MKKLESEAFKIIIDILFSQEIIKSFPLRRILDIAIQCDFNQPKFWSQCIEPLVLSTVIFESVSDTT